MADDDLWVWPTTAPASGSVVLRAFQDDDVAAAVALSRDPYVSRIGTLGHDASEQEAGEWVAAQRSRLAQRVGFSFAVADRDTDACVGFAGLWLRTVDTGTASGGYAVVPAERRRGRATDALRALTAFAWTRGPVARVELHVEPWNTGSRRAAVRAGYVQGRLLPGGHEIGGEPRDVVEYTTRRPAPG